MYIRGAVIKNPISFSLGFLRQFKMSGVDKLDNLENIIIGEQDILIFQTKVKIF